MRHSTFVLTIILPVFNEEENLKDGDVWRRITALEEVLNQGVRLQAQTGEGTGTNTGMNTGGFEGQYTAQVQYIFIDDGSSDQTFQVLQTLKQSEPRRNISIVRFTRNFGAWAAIRAGLDRSQGQAAFIQTIDGEEPPELILDMVAKWQRGAEVVWLEREAREDSLKSRLFARIYTYLMQKLVVKQYPDKGVAVPLLDLKVVRFLTQSRESNTPLIPLLYWAGFRQTSVGYVRHARKLGRSGWTFTKLLRVFTDSFLAFTFFPIRLFSLFGAGAAVIGFVWALALVAYRLFSGAMVVGYTSIMVTLLFFAGVQMVFLGVMGEYLWRILEQVKERPLYVVDEEK